MDEELPGTAWWKNAAIYQVYIRSFADGTGDGNGDLAGLRSRLSYIRSLGVDAIWVNPWYVSPLNDGGYDVTDYRDIDPGFGNLEGAEQLIAEADRLGLGVIADLVPNHTSSEHPWFQEALASPPGSAARARYHFRRGRGQQSTQPPTDWRSVFGGPAWTRLPDGEWYLHLFDVTQPDLNWQHDEVRAEFRDIIRFWLDRGTAGFRVDVAHGLSKHEEYPDVGGDVESLLVADHGDSHPFWDRPELHEVVREWRRVLDEYAHWDRPPMMVAEAWVSDWDRLALYLRPDEFHQVFDFEFLLSPWETASIREAISASLRGAATAGTVPTWVLSNHDVVRHATRYGLPQDIASKDWLLDGDRSLLDPGLGLRRARAGALLMLALPGSVYLYQGEELGLPEVHDLPTEVLQDPVWVRSGHTRKGRDGCRVPIPWKTNGTSFGFGPGAAWLPQPAWWGQMSVEAQTSVPTSTLEMYREALAIRRRHLVADRPALSWIDTGDDHIIAFERESGIRCLVNLGDRPTPLPDGRVLLSSSPMDNGVLPPDTAAWIG